jgi:hypothetical protein
MYGNRSCPECTYRERVYHEKMYLIQREVDYRVQEQVNRSLWPNEYHTQFEIRYQQDESTTKLTWTPMPIAQLSPGLVTEGMVVNANAQLNVQQFATTYPNEGWDMGTLKQLMELSEGKKEKKSMNVVKRLKTLSLSKEDKLLRKYQIVDDTGDLTGNGKEALWNILLEDNKTALVEKLSELEKSEKAKKA